MNVSIPKSKKNIVLHLFVPICGRKKDGQDEQIIVHNVASPENYCFQGETTSCFFGTGHLKTKLFWFVNSHWSGLPLNKINGRPENACFQGSCRKKKEMKLDSNRSMFCNLPRLCQMYVYVIHCSWTVSPGLDEFPGKICYC